MKLGDLKREAVLALESLPAEIRSQLHNLVVVVEDRPTRSQLRSLGLDPGRKPFTDCMKARLYPSARVSIYPRFPTRSLFSPAAWSRILKIPKSSGNR